MKRTILSGTLILVVCLLIGLAASPVFAVSYAAWAPYKGISEINREYSFQQMIWDNVTGFNSGSTYEHETIIYNATFADASSYWSSNLPLSYKDTRFSDSPFTDNFAIGSSSAINIVRGAWYYTYYDLRPTIFSTTSSSVLINGQLGHRSPSWCYQNTWCVFGDETLGLERLTAPHWGLPWLR